MVGDPFRFSALIAACLVSLSASASTPVALAPAPEPAVCSLDGMLEEARAGLSTGSPALKRYLKRLVKEAALSMPLSQVQAAFANERSPELLEALGAALAAKAGNTENPHVISSVLQRAARDPDEKLRAAAVRSLRASGSVELMEGAASDVRYEQLVRDESPEVRAAVMENLLAEDREVYSGHHQGHSEAALKVARASEDPEVKARLLSGISTETVGPAAVKELGTELGAGDPRVRAAAAFALGGVPASQAGLAREQLISQYRRDEDPTVRTAILQSLARLGQQQSIPVLRSLRGIAPGMDPEIERWIATLNTGLQEWHLLLREKQRRG